MGLFGFGKKKRQSEDAQQAAEEQAVDEAAAQAQEVMELPEPSAVYEGRGDERGPWDVDDEDVPDYDDYLDLGSYYLPFLQGIELRVSEVSLGFNYRPGQSYVNSKQQRMAVNSIG